MKPFLPDADKYWAERLLRWAEEDQARLRRRAAEARLARQVRAGPAPWRFTALVARLSALRGWPAAVNPDGHVAYGAR
jgi:hypothetical protein